MVRASKLLKERAGASSNFSVSETALRDALRQVISAINAGDPSVQYDFIVQRLHVPGLAQNWAVAATATTPWKAYQWNACQLALDEVRGAMPIIDWSCSALLVRPACQSIGD